jgi:hypothetical protein
VFFEELKVISMVIRFDTMAPNQDYTKRAFCQKFASSSERTAKKFVMVTHNIYLGRSVTLEDAGSGSKYKSDC